MARRHEVTDADRAAFRELFKAGQSLSAIGRERGFAAVTVRLHLEDMGIAVPKRTGRPKIHTCRDCGGGAKVAGRCFACRATYHREYNYRRKYGIGIQEYNELLARQNGKCATCGSEDSKSGAGREVFHIDHDHATGRVRGLLCYPCNYFLGVAGDNLEGLQRFVDYLTAAS